MCKLRQVTPAGSPLSSTTPLNLALMDIDMPYMPGGTLYQYIATHGPLSLEKAQYYLEQIAAALDHAHQHGCVHCDVKPANILLDEQGCGMLSDFGIARAMRGDPSGENQTTKGQEILLGTPNYISPEQALGRQLDGRSDVYSLGVTLFFLLAGHPPFHAESSIAMALLHVHAEPPSLVSLRGDVSFQMDAVVKKALTKLPEDRFQSAGEFSAAFYHAISTSSSVQQANTTDNHIAQMPARSSSRPSWMALVAVLVLLVTLGATLTTSLLTSHVARSTSRMQATAPTTIDTNVWADGLANNENGWPVSSTFFFANGQYHIQNKSARNVALALYAARDFANLRLTVTLSEVHGLRNGADYYGVVIRSAADQSHYYIFEVVAWNGGNTHSCAMMDNMKHLPLARLLHCISRSARATPLPSRRSAIRSPSSLTAKLSAVPSLTLQNRHGPAARSAS